MQSPRGGEKINSMKRNTLIVLFSTFTVVLAVSSGCSSDKRSPGKIYMPDMAYSRAVETYALLDSTSFTTNPDKLGEAIFYNATPVAGTMKIGALPPYLLPNDSAGYANSSAVKNPLTEPLRGADSVETARLFNINCAICHGETGAANGPLATSGKIGAIANLTLPMYVEKADGTMFHSIQYGLRNMGSYASQLTSKQRWQMVQYIRLLQPKTTAASATAMTTVAKDTVVKN
jgi:mono/diheme cytochrome c family protein